MTLFDEVWKDAVEGQECEVCGSKVMKRAVAEACVVCQKQTTWFDHNSGGAPICGPVCQNELQTRVAEQNTQLIMNAHIQVHRDAIIRELQLCELCDNRSKDILIVVHNQYNFVKICLESVMQRTENYKLYIWDNASLPETADYLAKLAEANPDLIHLARSEKNIGFVEPNNLMAAWGQGEYIILLNSDTQVFTGWDLGMLGQLQQTPNTAQVGFLGGLLLEDGRGEGGDFGYNVDYIAGFCSCMSRATYNKFGLFDPAYKFAYFEDSDLSLRLKAAGHDIYALHLMFCHHYQNQTVKAVKAENSIDLAATFGENQRTFQVRWTDYLKSQRVNALSPKTAD